jgi:hypothetical protein
LTASTSKKVMILRFDREPLEGFVNPQSFLETEGVHLLSQTGSLTVVPYQDIKMICFIKDFGQPPAEWARKRFASRPKSAGLWLRMRFRDGDIMDGLLNNDLLHLEHSGFTVSPPDRGAGSQRVFIPRAALTDLKVLGVVGSPLRAGRRRKQTPAADERQLEMFD